MSYESLEDLVHGNALRIGRVAIALRREAREVAQVIWQAMTEQPGGEGVRHRAQQIEAAMERLELEAESTEERQMEDAARERAGGVHRSFETLTNRIEALRRTLGVKDDIMMARAARRATAAWEAAKAAIDDAAANEGWAVEARARRKDELRGPVEGLLRQAHERRRTAALANWIRLGGEVTTEAKETAADVIREYPEDYTLQEAEHLLKKFKGWTW